MAELLDRLTAALADRFRIERGLGRGGMGVVFLAHDLKHDRLVALKVLRPEIAHTVNADRFAREIRIAARLQHPNILPLIDSGEADGLTYYVMPYFPGESLRDRLDREKQLPLDDALQIARDAAEGLSHAHDQGFVHRDIKPENILLGAGHAVIADFGIAHAVFTLGEKLTETGIAVGTPAYMSPEQAGGSGEFDHRTDVYSLGCVVYEMLGGSPPFTGSHHAIMARKALEPVPSLRVIRETIPPQVEQAVMKALAKTPADRFASARQFADALAGDARALGVGARAAGPGRRAWLLAGAIGALVFVAGTYVLIAGKPWGGGSFAAERVTFTQLTSAPGVEWFPSLSPDGRWIVYAGEQSGNRDIYLQNVGGQVPINLTEESAAEDDQPAFSPDGQRIAFRSSRDGGGIFVMGSTGEGVRRVTRRGFRPTWSPDGQQLAFTTENVEMNPGNSEAFSELWVVGVDGRDPRKLNTGDAILASWSPHGQRIAYAQRLGISAQGDIYTISPYGGEAVAVTTDAARDWSPSWSRDGRHLYFSSDRSGSMNLWRIAIDEQSGEARGAPEPVTTPATFLAHPTLSSDGRHIAYTSAQTTINIQRVDFDPASGTVRSPPVNVTTGSRRWSSPDPSPDGEWVAFYTLDQPEGHIYVARSDGTGLRQVTGDTAIDRLPRWSPDGRQIAFFSNRGGPLQIWKVGADGSGLRRLVDQPGGYGPTWSPDGTRMAVVLGATSVGDTLAIIDPGRSAAEQRIELLPHSTIGQFLVNSWSSDGERLVGQVMAVGGMGRGVGTYSFRTRSYEKLTDFGEWPTWLPDSRRVLFVANRDAFYVVDSRTKQVRKVFSVTRDVIGPPRLTRDGGSAYFSRRSTEGDIWLVTLSGER